MKEKGTKTVLIGRTGNKRARMAVMLTCYRWRM
jgi:hypothetical protein